MSPVAPALTLGDVPRGLLEAFRDAIAGKPWTWQPIEVTDSWTWTPAITGAARATVTRRVDAATLSVGRTELEAFLAAPTLSLDDLPPSILACARHFAAGARTDPPKWAPELRGRWEATIHPGERWYEVRELVDAKRRWRWSFAAIDAHRLAAEAAWTLADVPTEFLVHLAWICEARRPTAEAADAWALLTEETRDAWGYNLPGNGALADVRRYPGCYKRFARAQLRDELKRRGQATDPRPPIASLPLWIREFMHWYATGGRPSGDHACGYQRPALPTAEEARRWNIALAGNGTHALHVTDLAANAISVWTFAEVIAAIDGAVVRREPPKEARVASDIDVRVNVDMAELADYERAVERVEAALDRINRKEQAMTTKPSSQVTPETGVAATLKADATDAAVRTGARQLVRLAREPLCAALARHLAPGDESVRARVAAFLATDAGTALLSGVLGFVLTVTPGVAERVPAALATELRVAALSGGADLLADAVTGPVLALLAQAIKDVPQLRVDVGAPAALDEPATVTAIGARSKAVAE